MKVIYLTNASGDKFACHKTPWGHWRATQATGNERNYAGIPASLKAHGLPALRKALAKHYSN